MEEWRPASEAPQNTRDVVLVAGWRELPCLAYRCEGRWYEASAQGGFEVAEAPTHWMPLPPEPAEAFRQVFCREAECRGLYAPQPIRRRLRSPRRTLPPQI